MIRKLLKNKFTLIELIVVIGILAILASLVLPNIKGTEGEARGVALATDRKAIQTAVDMYKIDNVDDPILDGEVIVIGVPGTISMNKLYPKYLRDFPGTAGAKYWLDYTGKVWVSLADAPVIMNNEETLSWEAVDGATEYIIYEYSEISSNTRYNLIEIARTKETSYIGLEAEGKYLIQSVDYQNNLSPLVDTQYSGYKKELVKEEAIDEELTVKTTIQEQLFTSASEFTQWVSLTKSEIIPEGTSIAYSFQVSNDQINWSQSFENISETPKGKYLKIKIEKKSINNLTPTVSDIRVEKIIDNVQTTSTTKKINEKINLNNYNNIIHVYGGKELSSIYNSASNGDLIYLHQGTYSLTREVWDKKIDFVGENQNTKLIIQSPSYRRIYYKDASGMGYVHLQSTADTSLFNMIIETRGENTYANYFYNEGSMAFYNVVLNNFFDLAYTDIVGGNVYFYNSTFTDSGSQNMTIRRLSDESEIVFQNSYGNIVLDDVWSTFSLDPALLNDCMIKDPEILDTNFNILHTGWQNGGIGTNPDGTTSHIGVYGGPNAWD